MTKLPRGRCIIVINEHFDTLPWLNGSEKDIKNVKGLFERLHFKVEVHTDQTVQVKLTTCIPNIT